MEPATPKAVLVGFDKLQSYLDKQSSNFDAIKIANTHNDKTNWRKEFAAKTAAGNIPQLIEYLQEWAPDNAPYTWWICLFKSGKQVERFPFSVVGGAMAMPSVGGVDSAMVQQLIEAERRAAIAEMQLNQLATQQLEDDEDEDEDEQPDYIGAIMPMITPHIPALMQGLIAKFAVNEPLAVNGVEDLPGEAIEVVKSLMKKGVTVEHLKKLNAMPGAKIKSLLLML
jgi:hypothetical protein